MQKRNSGFSLLEVIIVLALIGMMLVMLASYKKKQAEELRNEVNANALVQEMYGFLKFANEDEVALDNTTTPEINPLYIKGQGAIAAYADVFDKRVKNILTTN